MNESPLRMFCESRHRKLIVAIVTSLVGLALLLPLSDEYFDNRESRRTLTDDLDRVQKMEDTLPSFMKRAASQEAKVQELEGVTVSEASIASYRDAILEMVRESGCQMRNLQAGQPTTRPWLKDDNPLIKQVKATKKNKTPFKLERRSLSLLVDGDMTSIYEFLTRFEEEKKTAFPHKVRLTNATGRGGTATLEMNLWLFALTR